MVSLPAMALGGVSLTLLALLVLIPRDTGSPSAIRVTLAETSSPTSTSLLTPAIAVSVDAGATPWPLEPAFGLGALTATWEQEDLDPNLFAGLRPNMWRFYDLDFASLFPATLMPPNEPTPAQWSYFDSEMRRIAREIKVVKDAGASVGADPDRMPRWLSSCAENEGTLPQFSWDSPLWAVCPPIDYAKWSDLFGRVVTIFAEEGLTDFYWGVWNEPEWAFYGTEDEYLELYRVTARAVRQANPQAKVGGTNDVNLMSRKWQYDKHNPIVDFGTLTRAPEPLMKRLLEVVGREQLPLDFIDWHFPTTDPRSDALASQVQQARDWLTANNLDPNTPIRIGEWTVSPCGDETAGELSAAYVVAMLKEMARLGIALHNHTSMRDQAGWTDECWTHVGLFSKYDNRPAGVARAKFNAFRLVSRLLPERVPATYDDPFVDAVATTEPSDGKLTILLANYVNPSAARVYQMVRQEVADRGIVTPEELAAFDACVAQQREEGSDLKAAITYCLSQLPLEQQQEIAQVVQEIQAWIDERKTAPVTVTLSVSSLPDGAYDLTRYAIDWEHGNVCRYNKRTEPAPSAAACGEGGAVDERWEQAVATARAASADELRRRNWTENDLAVLEQGLLAACPTGQGMDAFRDCVEQWFLDHPDSFSKPDAEAEADFWAAVEIYLQTLALEESRAAAELNALPEVGLAPAEQRRINALAGGLLLEVTLIPNGVALVELAQAPLVFPRVQMLKDIDGDPFTDDSLQNLWICLGPTCTDNGEGFLDIQEFVIPATATASDPDGVGAFEFQLKFDHKAFDITITPTNWLYSTGRIPGAPGIGGCAVTIVLENDIRFGCVSEDDPNTPAIETGVNTAGAAAIIHVTPEADLVNRITPGQRNGQVRVLLNENCELADIFGDPLSTGQVDDLGRPVLLPGIVTGGLVEDCLDTVITVRMLEGDLDLDCDVDVADDQQIALRYGAVYGNLAYDPFYDLEPWNKDMDIDIKDVHRVFARNGSTCQNPIPPQPPEQAAPNGPNP